MNIARSLLAAAAASACLASITTVQAQDVAAGEKKASMCIGCHGIPGYQSSFPEVNRVPMVSGQNAKYIVASLNAYKKGERRHPTMRAIAGSMTEQDMADVAAWYAGHQRSPVKTIADTPAVTPSAEVAALLNKGICASCHGANFNKPIDGSYPKVAGQHSDYLYAALRSYKVEGNPNVGRANAIMAAQVKAFSNRELKLMADYLGSLPGELHTVPLRRFR